MAGKWLFPLPWKQSVHFKRLGVGGWVLGVAGQGECLTLPPPSLLYPRASLLCRSLLRSHQELPFRRRFYPLKIRSLSAWGAGVEGGGCGGVGGTVPTLSSRLVCKSSCFAKPRFLVVMPFKKEILLVCHVSV